MENNRYTPDELITDESFVQWVLGRKEGHWEQWSSLSPENKVVTEQAKGMIMAMKFKHEELSVEKIEDMKGHIEQKIAQGSMDNEAPLYPDWKGVFRIAAAVALLIAGAFVFYNEVFIENTFVDAPVALQYMDKSTPKGARVTFKLSDGTMVNLNANSKLIYPEKFDGKNREVYLEGEGFFDVTENAQKPFIVTTGDIQTRVLGTTFNVKASSNQDMVQVALVSGSVSIFDKKSEKSMILTPDEMATYDRKSNSTVKSYFDKEMVLGWKDQLLVFSNTDFQEVIRTLENWYGVSVIVKTDESIEKGFTGRYHNKSLETVLKGLSFSYGFEFRITDQVVIIY